MTPKRNAVQLKVKNVDASGARDERDVVAVEEPLEIRIAFESPELNGKFVTTNLAVTMRTPGHDYELAAGFLFSEGILTERAQLHEISYCVGIDKANQQFNVLSVRLRPGVAFDAAKLQRNFYTTSSCGVCGKSSIEAVRTQCQRAAAPQSTDTPRISKDTLLALPQTLRAAQSLFEQSGGNHAAGLFTSAGKLISVREDVGRHNAVDKVIGEQFLADRLPLREAVLLVSGRASFELVQKAVMAGIPVLAAVGAPSSLAVELAEESGLSLIGFLRGERFNIYNGAARII